MKHMMLLLLLCVFILSGCKVLNPELPSSTTPDVESSATDSVSTPDVTEIAAQTLKICTAELPESLFLYDGVQTAVKENILTIMGAVPFENQADAFEPVLIEKLPDLADGDLRLETVTVEEGQPVVNAAGEVAVLQPGLEIRPGGCRAADCVIAWDGETSLEMDQMVLEFKIVDNLIWSDGVPVTAVDSVFSFNIASDDQAPGLGWAESRTQSYLALDTATTQWTGLPGFSTASLNQFFWVPLPSHLFADSVAWSDLMNGEQLVKMPLSYGPFTLAEVSQSGMRFVPNPYYFRAEEGLPILNEVILQVVSGGAEEAVSLLKSGSCDAIDASFNLVENQDLLSQIRSDNNFSLITDTGESWVQLVYGIMSSSSVAGNATSTSESPTVLADVRLRQAIAACLDREKYLATTLGDVGEVWGSFLPPEMSQISIDETLAYDPQRGMDLLVSLGWVDHDGDPATPLKAQGVNGILDDTILSLELLSSTSAFHQALAQGIQADLGVCGIEVTHTALPAKTLYAPGPEGPLFGRQFDLALIAWQPLPQQDCDLYDSGKIPSSANYWIGTNISGLADAIYDDACRSANLALLGEADEAIHVAEEAFLDVLPSVPLFSIPRVMILPVNACENGRITSESAFFRHLEDYQVGGDCQ